MRKLLVLILTLVLSLVVASVAFAHSSNFVYYGDAHSGWVSNGQHGHYWSGDVDYDYPVYKKLKVVVLGAYDDDYIRIGNRYRYYSYNDKVRYYYDYDADGDWYYYLDDNKKAHYVYIDPDRDGKWVRYRDRDGNVQYHYAMKY